MIKWTPIIPRDPERYGYIANYGRAIVKKDGNLWHFTLKGWGKRKSPGYTTSKRCMFEAEEELSIGEYNILVSDGSRWNRTKKFVGQSQLSVSDEVAEKWMEGGWPVCAKDVLYLSDQYRLKLNNHTPIFLEKVSPSEL